MKGSRRRQGVRHGNLQVASLLFTALLGLNACRGSCCFVRSTHSHSAATQRVKSLAWSSATPATRDWKRRVVSRRALDAPPDTTVAIVHEFVDTVKKSIDDQTFVSLLFKGPTLSKSRRRNDPSAKERLRGCVRQIHGRLIALPKQRNQVCLQTTIKYHGATDVAKNYNMDQLVSGLTALLLSEQDDSALMASEWGETVASQPFGSDLGIQLGVLQTTLGNWHLHPVAATKTAPSHNELPLEIKFQKETPAPAASSSSSSSLPIMSHDRTKDVPLSTSASFLQALGLTKADGKPRPQMSSKLKQCQKFVEIVSGLIDSSITAMATAGCDTEVSAIHIVDAGCGRGYLTFSLHSFLFEKYGDMIHSVGVDMRPKLVKEISGIARSLPDFQGLTFQEGTIEGVLSKPNKKDPSSLDVLIALHACDTATDDALMSAIQNECNVVVVAPCCHKQVRRQLDRHMTRVKSEHPLADVLRHNIYRERIAETVTDSLRALLLEIANYNVQVFEFVGGEHTGKNVMIAGVKRRRSRSKKELVRLRERVSALASLHGVQEQRLAEWLNESLVQQQQIRDGDEPKRKLSSKRMPPLH